MNREQFEKAMNGLDDKYIQEAVSYEKPASKRGRIVRIGSLAACAVVVLVGVIGLINGGTKASGGANKTPEPETQAAWDYNTGFYSADKADAVEDGDWTPQATWAAEAEAEAPAMGNAAVSADSLGSGLKDRAQIGTAGQIDASKIIYTANLHLESQDFDAAYEAIGKIVETAGGYYENNTVYDEGTASRTASITVRLPQEQFDAALTQLKKVCHVTYSNQTAKNVSEEYYDVQSRLETAKIKLERLQNLLASATEMSDIIELENAISDTQWQVDYLSGDLRRYDSLIGYSTIQVDLDEVQVLTDTDPEPVSLGARIKGAFMNGLHAIGDGVVAFVLWFVSNIVWIVLIAAAVIAAVVIVKKKRKRM